VFFSKIYDRIRQGVEEKNCVLKFFFHRAYDGQAKLIRTNKPLDQGDDAKVFAPIRSRLGLDRCRMIVTGAAPCPAYIIEFLRIICKDAQVLQGYGMTETSAGITIVIPGDHTMGHCGAPFPCCEVKLRDVPEMKYLHSDPTPSGEIMCRGANVFAGYYKNEEATKETIEEGGWLATGDIGRFNPNGTLSIIDRKKISLNCLKVNISLQSELKVFMERALLLDKFGCMVIVLRVLLWLLLYPLLNSQNARQLNFHAGKVVMFLETRNTEKRLPNS